MVHEDGFLCLIFFKELLIKTRPADIMQMQYQFAILTIFKFQSKQLQAAPQFVHLYYVCTCDRYLRICSKGSEQNIF